MPRATAVVHVLADTPRPAAHARTQEKARALAEAERALQAREKERAAALARNKDKLGPMRAKLRRLWDAVQLDEHEKVCERRAPARSHRTHPAVLAACSQIAFFNDVEELMLAPPELVQLYSTMAEQLAAKIPLLQEVTKREFLRYRLKCLHRFAADPSKRGEFAEAGGEDARDKVSARARRLPHLRAARLLALTCRSADAGGAGGLGQAPDGRPARVGANARDSLRVQGCGVRGRHAGGPESHARGAARLAAYTHLLLTRLDAHAGAACHWRAADGGRGHAPSPGTWHRPAQRQRQ